MVKKKKKNPPPRPYLTKFPQNKKNYKRNPPTIELCSSSEKGNKNMNFFFK